LREPTGNFLLWFDDSAKPLSDKVLAAAARYEHKFGVYPTVCYVHPAALEKKLVVNGIRIEADDTTLRFHLRIGVEQ
jgi:hypothetical protein